MSRYLTTVLLLLVAPRIAQAQADAWWRHVTVLAHDSMAGRNAGSPEHRKAAEYIATNFARAGLEPAGTAGFMQPVQFRQRSLDESRSSLTLVRGGKRESLALGADASFVLRAPLRPTAGGEVVFAGYGLHLPEFNHDDLAGLDLKGKIVAYVTGMPKGIPGPVVSHTRNQAWPVFRQRGAIGMLVLSGSATNDSMFIRSAANRLAPQLTLSDTSLDVQRGNALSLQFNAARAEKLFSGASVRFATIAAAAAAGDPLPHFALGVELHSTTAVTEGELISDNVAGILRGSDPVLRDEYVVVTAHHDHTGIGSPVRGDSIYNGAMDNASGTALLIETARTLAARRSTLKRSVLFVAVTAEEKGLLGSRYFAFRPTVPAASMVANLNTDMFLPHMPLRMVMLNGLEESDLAVDARRVGSEMGIQVITDPEPEENRFVRSDQYSFVLRGIPALSPKVGYGRDTPEHEIVKRFRATRYHFPSDDLEQPIDRQSAEDFGRFYVRLVEEVANRAIRPSWNADSYFRRFAGVRP